MNISIANTHKIPAASASNTKQRLALAEALLLAPFDLCRTDLHKVLAAMHTRQIDDADLYFQSTCSEGWSLEEGIVKSGSFSIDQGVGVRAMSGEKTAFAYSDDISQAALMDAVRNVRTIGCAATARRAAQPKAAKGKPPPLPKSAPLLRATCMRLSIPSSAWTVPPKLPCLSASKKWRAPKTRASSRSWPA
jgi:TldD protein